MASTIKKYNGLGDLLKESYTTSNNQVYNENQQPNAEVQEIDLNSNANDFKNKINEEGLKFYRTQSDAQNDKNSINLNLDYVGDNGNLYIKNGVLYEQQGEGKESIAIAWVGNNDNKGTEIKESGYISASDFNRQERETLANQNGSQQTISNNQMSEKEYTGRANEASERARMTLENQSNQSSKIKESGYISTSDFKRQEREALANQNESQQTISSNQMSEKEYTGRANEASERARMTLENQSNQSSKIKDSGYISTSDFKRQEREALANQNSSQQTISNNQMSEKEYTGRANEASERTRMARETQQTISNNQMSEKEYSGRANEASERARMALENQSNQASEIKDSGYISTSDFNRQEREALANQKQVNSIKNTEIDNYDYNYNKTISCNNIDEEILNKDSKLKGYISQGMTTAGDYKVYGFIKKDGDKTVASAISITDKDGKIIKTFTTNDTSLIGHANDLEFDSKTGNVYIATMNKNAPLKSFNLSEAVNSKNENLTLKNENELFNKCGLKNLSGFTIDKKTGNMYFASGKDIKVVKDGEVIQTIKKQSNSNIDNSHEGQGIFAKDGKLYVIRYNRNANHSNGGNDVSADSATASANMIDVYENGEYSKTISVEAPTYTNEKGQQVISEMESISFDENTGKYNANFYYKTVSNDNNSRGCCTTNFEIDSPIQVGSIAQ